MADDGLNSKFDRKNKRYKQQRDKRRRGKGGAKGADNAGWDDRKSKGYDEIVKENALLDTYYKAQGNVAEEEWEAYMGALKRPLPTTFRFAGSRSHALDVRDAMVNNYLPAIRNISTDIDGEIVAPPAPMPWHPNDLAWTLYITRTMLRKSPELTAFHQFLISETEAGNISRQEAVSMIPPLVLDVKPGHWVLDMCAAPGSKTAQLAEFLEDRETSTRSGLLVANDADYRRAQIMVRQVKRVNSPCLIVTNHEAQMFPGVTVKHPDGTEGPISFDRILADVPCSGDGTLRKNLPIWKDWNPHTANSLHTLQLRILMRAVQLCRPGGRIVYSTCSMNPVENEAVVAEAIRKSEIPLELLDAAQMLPNLKSRPGMLKWKVMTKTGVLCGTAEEAPVESPISKVPSLFAQPDLESLNIARCMRIVPHDQDTGAFFIAVLQVGSASKTQTEAADMNGQAETVMESDDTTNVPCKRPPADSEDAPAKKAKVEKEFKIPGPLDRKWGEDPFIYLPDDDEALREVKEIYGISDDFPFQQTVTRSVGPRHKTIYFTSNDVKSLLQAKDVHRLKVVNAGLKLFVRNDSDKGALTPYRVHSEGLPYLVGHLSEKRVIKGVPAQDIFTLLQTEYPKLSEFTPETAEKLASMGQGCVVLQARPTGQEGSLPLKEPPLLTTWMARVSCNLLLNKADRQSLLIRLGVDLKTAELVQKRIEKAQTAQAMAAAKSNEEEKLDEEPAEADEDDAPADDEDGSEDEMN